MAKNRMVSTSFWSDHYVADLDPTEKLLFLYLLTCERSTLAGVYELPIKMIAVESGIEGEMVRKILSRFEEDDKVKYQDGWVAVKNFLKHHEHGSPTIRKGIDEAVKSAPEWARGFIGKGIDTLSPSALSLASTSIGASRLQVVKVYEEEEKPERLKKDTSYYQVYELFGSPWPLDWKTNTTQITAAKNLLIEQGLEDCKEAMAFYNAHKTEEYCPKISTPLELSRKWSKLEDHVDRIKS